MPEPALIFDYGNVIAFFDYMYAFERLGARMGVSGEVFRQRVVAGGFPDFLAEFESGRIAPEEFATAITAICGLDIPYPEFVEAWKDIFRLNESVAELIKALKSRGYPLLLGSNTNVLHATHYRRHFAHTIDLFDHLILSYEVGCMKPDARILPGRCRGRKPSARFLHLHRRSRRKRRRGAQSGADRIIICRYSQFIGWPKTTGSRGHCC